MELAWDHCKDNGMFSLLISKAHIHLQQSNWDWCVTVRHTIYGGMLFHRDWSVYTDKLDTQCQYTSPARVNSFHKLDLPLYDYFLEHRNTVTY